jgi:hypothetical protein
VSLSILFKKPKRKELRLKDLNMSNQILVEIYPAPLGHRRHPLSGLSPL